jgi:hypothetical protein
LDRDNIDPDGPALRARAWGEAVLKMKSSMRIIEGLYEMQPAQKSLEASSMAILHARGSHVLDIWLCCEIHF